MLANRFHLSMQPIISTYLRAVLGSIVLNKIQILQNNTWFLAAEFQFVQFCKFSQDKDGHY